MLWAILYTKHFIVRDRVLSLVRQLIEIVKSVRQSQIILTEFSLVVDWGWSSLRCDFAFVAQALATKQSADQQTCY